MTTNHQRDFLSFGDALFLYLEREGTPLNIASVAVFEGAITLNELTRFVESKLPLIPRYLQRVVVPPFNIGIPSWEYAHDFTISNHVRELSLKHGTATEFKIVASAVLSPVMDRKNPLWDLTLVHGLKRQRSALIFRVHHCLADGISGIGLLNTLLDPSPGIPKLPKHRARMPVRPARPTGSLLIEAAMQTWFTGLERVLSASDELLELAHRLATGAPNFSGGLNNGAVSGTSTNPDGEDFTRMLSELVEIPDRLPFNLVCRGPQRFEWTEVPFADLRAMKNAAGVSLNDVVLALLTSAFGRYSQSRGVSVRGRSLRIVVPVSARGCHNSNDLGNHITFAPVSTPLGTRDPKRLLASVHERMQFVKTARLPDLVALAGTVLATIPAPLQAAVAPLLSRLPISVCNTICTNVPGPKFPLYLLGHKMVRAYPYVPIGGEMGINCAVLTYDGTAHFGFTGDVHAAPHLELLPRFLNQAFMQMRRALDVRGSRVAPRRKPASAEPATSEPTHPVERVPSPVTEPQAAPVKSKAATASAA